MTSLRDLILAADDIPSEDVPVPEWGVTVQVRGLSGADRDAYEARMAAARQSGGNLETAMRNFRSRFLVKCLYDPSSGERVFADDDANRLGKKAGAVVDRLFDVARRLSGMDDGAVEAAEGNSDAAPSGSSTTD